VRENFMHRCRPATRSLADSIAALRPAPQAGDARRPQLAAGPKPRRGLTGLVRQAGQRLPPARHPRTEELARLEATLFLAREPLTVRRLAKLARLDDASRARVLLTELRLLLDAAGSAFRVELIAGGYQLLTRSAFGPWVRRLLDVPPGGRLSAAALETLAIVAYRQPVTRAEIESIRGVGSEEMLRQLMERDLVAIGGRAEDLGRPNVYVTTRRFLATFGLARLEDLSPVEPLRGVSGETGGDPREAAEAPL
jgi:segregation and condensation protein B